MSNNNLILQSNNASLQTIFNTVNNLPSRKFNAASVVAYIQRDIDNSYIENLSPPIIGSVAFFGDYANLTEISSPYTLMINHEAFGYCINLTSVDFPMVLEINTNAFVNCINLNTAKFSNIISIEESAFSSCYNLKSLTLGANQLCTLVNSNAFDSTPIAGYISSTNGIYGSIYVPASLISSYKLATNWTYFSDRFVPIEGGE